MIAENRLLFVFNPDDSDEYFQNYVKSCQSKYTYFLADSIEKAKSLLKTESIDLVVTSSDLPNGTSTDFQKYIFENYNPVLRFLYTRKNDNSIVNQSAKYVHQFIYSECTPDQLLKIIENSFSLKNVLNNKALHNRIASITDLPSPPEIYNQLVEELQNEDPSIRKIAVLIKKDVSITAKVLRMINSTFFGLQTHIESPLHAVNLLGIETIQSIVLTASMFNLFKEPEISGYSIDSIYTNSLAVGTSSRHLANAFGLMTKHTEDALMAGMLHDIGKLIMLSYFPDEFKKSIQISVDEAIPLFEAEERILGVNDAEIGAHLLSLWGLPNSILEAIALHYNPTEAPAPITNVLTAVHLGYAINHDIQNNIRETNSSAIDMNYLEKLNLDTNVDSLKNFCMAATA